MIERAYIEIGNICNLACSFCPGTKREPRQMDESEFTKICEKLQGKVKFLYFHLMGEPLVHPLLDRFLGIAECFGFKVCITTNGTLLEGKGDILLSHSTVLHKVSISLHAPEGNSFSAEGSGYLSSAAYFAEQAAERGIFTVFRLWNMNSTDALGKNSENSAIETYLHKRFSFPWEKRQRGYRLAKNIFLEYDGVFVWPSESGEQERERGYCHALSQQIAILADGTVVPCCLDSEGMIALGNIFSSSLQQILNSERAVLMRRGFSAGVLCEMLCRKCSYSKRFSNK